MEELLRTLKSALFIIRINNIINYTVILRGSLSRLNSETVRALDQVTDETHFMAAPAAPVQSNTRNSRKLILCLGQMLSVYPLDTG